jgi:hypothetical protein
VSVPAPCPTNYYEQAGQFVVPPILDFGNDTFETLVIRRVDAEGYRSVTIEPGCRAVASNGGAFFGQLTLEQEAQEPGILVGVFTMDGQSRGFILFAPSYLSRAAFSMVCLSLASDPPYVVRSFDQVRQDCP